MSNDMGTTQRRGMSPQRRLRIWERHKGACCLCHRKIDGARERWIVEHIRALLLGGADHDDNCAPAHASCATAKTRADVALGAKAKRVKQRHLGMLTTKTPMPHGRNSPTKRKMDGSVVARRPKA